MENKKKDIVLAILVHGFTAAMLAVFLLQAKECINKYLESKVVEDVSERHLLKGKLPPMTVCSMPSMNLGGRMVQINKLQDLSYACQGHATYRECMDYIHFTMDEIIFTHAPVGYNTTKSAWRKAPRLIPTGHCFELYSDTEIPSSALIFDLVLLNMTTINQMQLSFTLYFHNPGQLIPSLGMSQNFMAQYFMFYAPKPNFLKSLMITVNHRKNLNTEEKPCVKEEGYSIYRCAEGFIRSRIGCASPWDLHNDHRVRECTTNEEFDRLFLLQRQIMGIGSPQFYDLTKCAPPCEYDEIEFSERELMVATLGLTGVTENMPFEIAGVQLVLQTSSKKIIVQNYLYDINNLVGEIGGSMGLFLGASLISLFELMLKGSSKVTEKLS